MKSETKPISPASSILNDTIRPLKRLAIVHPWPGIKNSELDIMRRIRNVCGTMGISVELISPTGQLLDSDGCYRKPFVVLGDPTFPSVDAVLYLHYLVPKYLDAVSFLTNWNPVDFLLKNPATKEDQAPGHIRLIKEAFQSMDCILSADSPHADCFVQGCLQIPFAPPCRLDWGVFHTTCQVEKEIEFPSLTSFSVFYITANWEKMNGLSRFGSLTDLLDESGKFSFYGIRKHGDVDVWAGVRSYKGELPFDGGKSIIRESNRCGVTLVLHSREHHTDALVSTRIFQACAAKTVIICDDNPWIMRNFGDSVLTIRQNYDNPQETAAEILKVVQWIENHKESAIEKAKKAHQIFLQKFTLEAELSTLCQKYEMIARQRNSLHLNHDTVDVIWRYDRHYFGTFVEDILKQEAVHVRVIVVVSSIFRDEAERLLSDSTIHYKLIVSEKHRRLGDIVLETILAKDAASSITVFQSNTRWFSNHLSSLASTLDCGYSCAQSGTFTRNTTFRESDYPDYYWLCHKASNEYHQAIALSDISSFNSTHFMASSFLFSTSDCRSLGNCLDNVQFFGPGYYMYLLSCLLMQGHDFPPYTGKLTNVFERSGDVWYIDNYYNSTTSQLTELGLFQSFVGGEWLRCNLISVPTGEEPSSNSATPIIENFQKSIHKNVSFPIKKKKNRQPIEWLKARRRAARAYAFLKQSALICEDYYRKQVPDLPQNADLVMHYISKGAYDGVNPCADFDTKYYLTVNTDVREADVNPLFHFLEHGFFEGRNPSQSLSCAEIMTNASLAKTSSLCAFLRNRNNLS